MRRILTTSALVLASVAALTGCNTLQDTHSNYFGRDEKLTQVVGNVWRLDYVWSGKHAETQINESMRDRATDLCAKNDMGMLPIKGTSVVAADESKTTGWLEFRCERPVDVTEGGLFSDHSLTFKIKVPGEDDKDAKDSKK